MQSPFPPIAIVGRSAVLPGALDPRALWKIVLGGHSALSPARPGRWGLDPADVAADPAGGAGASDRCWSDVGGYVRGFSEIFSGEGFGIPAEEALGLDPLFQWVLHAGREALRDAGLAEAEGVLARTGLILGNLSYPSETMARYGECVWLERQTSIPNARGAALIDRPGAEARFMSGLPAHLGAAALGLGGASWSLDAACASALYAIKLGCDQLHDRRVDAVLAGAVNRADDLFLHVGFCGLQALSRTGQSRPFHRGADGLIPAEGCAFVVLRRLEDAERAGERILGVIRGVGLSNDGRGEGLLTPSTEGQIRALQLAYQQAGLRPDQVQLLECHATGTPVGDRTELKSVASVWGDAPLALGSLKGNLGHLITAAGLAGLLKVLSALEHRTLPPGRPVDQPIDGLQGGLRLLQAPEAWHGSVTRRAGVSAFGFGGNNAHLIVEEAGATGVTQSAWSLRPDPVAIVGVGVVAADTSGVPAFTAALMSDQHRPRRVGRTDEIQVPLAGLRTPPHDLKHTLAQQTALMQAVAEAIDGVEGLDRARTGVLMGMGTDAEVTRYGLRWRLATYARRWLGEDPPSDWLAAARDAVQPALNAAGVLGAMPNVVANRLNHQHDLAGPSFSVSAEQQSGTRALELAARALRAGELDAAVVGAVDFACNPVHEAAAAALGLEGPPGDASVVLVLQRLVDAERLGNRVLAIVDPEGGAPPPGAARQISPADLAPRFGHPHAAEGLLALAAGALSVAHGALPSASGSEPQAWVTAAGATRAARVTVGALGGGAEVITVRSGGEPLPLGRDRARKVLRFAAEDPAGLLAALRAGTPGGEGPCRAAIVAADPARRELLRGRAVEALEAGATPWGDGLSVALAPMEGELAALFTGAAGPYPGMGAALFTAFPEVLSPLADRVEDLADAIWPDDGQERARDPASQMVFSSLLAQAHAVFTRDVLGLRPTAAIGYSLGESNAMHAMGAWDALTPMMRELRAAPLFTTELAGDFAAVRRDWTRQGFSQASHPGPIWENWTIKAPRAAVEAAVEGAPRVHLLLVNTPDEHVIGGFPAEVRALIAALGAPAAPLEYPLAVHCPEVRELAETWLQWHRRPVQPTPGVRFYSAGWGHAYEADSERAAAAMLAHGSATLDFPRVVERAWQDGVRIFVEHGPRCLTAGWVRRILAGRPHLAVSLDAPDRPGLLPIADAVAQLWTAGVALDAARLRDFDAPLQPEAAPGAFVRLPAHPPEVVLPALPRRAAPPPAPALPPITEVPVSLSPVSTPAQTAPEAPAAPEAPEAPAAPAEEEAPAAPAQGLSAAAAVLLQGQADVGAAHLAHLRAAADAHARFLSLTGQANDAFARGVAGGGAGPTLRLPVAAAPPPVAAAPVQAPVAAPVPAAAQALPGPKFSRADLEHMARGRISERFGPLFERQDGYARQVRMPAPPLLLCDRVTGIDAPPGELQKGTIWTESDVTWDAWYLHHGRMPPGVMIESGQADLLLVSWLGIDFLNQGERVYRLLGCTLSYHGTAPRPGETLCYQIHIDGFASHGDVRLFFFHYDCTVNGELRLSVRGGQAGFFTDAELADSDGVIWDAASNPPESEARVDPPEVLPEYFELDKAKLEAFAAGDLESAFGKAFFPAHCHTRTPTIAGGRMLLIDRVTHLEMAGGPWGRGYLRAEQDLHPDLWFFDGHFHNDPCMPGTLMFEGCVQTLAIFMASRGLTLSRDGWRFQPVRDQSYPMRCRGQAIPTSKLVVYEVFVEALVNGPVPTLTADVLVTVDGLAAFHCKGLGVELVPDWPITSRPQLMAEVGYDPNIGLPATPNPEPFDTFAMLASGIGRPSDAFGPMYQIFDGARKAPRLPGPPYWFMSRVKAIDCPPGELSVGAVAEVEYDVPPDAWYFEQNHGLMPFSVLLEVALQPCGWLASWVGGAIGLDMDVFFRNLDGDGVLHQHVGPDAGTLTTRTKITRISRLGGVTLTGFELTLSGKQGVIYTLKTGFGFFPAESLAKQDGLPKTAASAAAVVAPGEAVARLSRDPALATPEQRGPAGLPAGMLLMLDEVRHVMPSGGPAGLGRLVGHGPVDPRAWYFKAHFFQDPVQPGSLGIEAMIQALRFMGLHQGLLDRDRRYQLALGRPMQWRYRGQVRPHNALVSLELDLTARDSRGPVGDASLWVDGLRIYEAIGLALEPV